MLRSIKVLEKNFVHKGKRKVKRAKLYYLSDRNPAGMSFLFLFLVTLSCYFSQHDQYVFAFTLSSVDRSQKVRLPSGSLVVVFSNIQKKKLYYFYKLYGS
jgi:hypothetical protein